MDADVRCGVDVLPAVAAATLAFIASILERTSELMAEDGVVVDGV